MIGVLVVLLTVAFFNSCQKRAVTEPEKEAAPTTKIESVEEQSPQMERPQLTEEEIFQRNTLEAVNQQGYLQKIHFEYDKYLIKDDMKPAMEKNAEWLLQHPSVEIRIEGHCDERGTEEYNIALGEKRADSAKNYLVSLGVAEGKILVVSYGKSKPVYKGTNEASHYQNRRDEFIITKK
jgi:peptidoglycan-associated lipoprotein